MTKATTKALKPSAPAKQLESYPQIPAKRYFSIGEVSQLCLEEPHVLRYWEQQIPQLTPATRRGGRRYYARKDILLIREIRDMLRTQGYMLKGVRQWLAGNREKPEVRSQSSKQALRMIREELSDVLRVLGGEQPLG